MEKENDDEPIDVEDGSDFGDIQGQRFGSSEPSPSPTLPPPSGEDMAAMPQIPPPGSGARLGFLLGVQPSLSSSRARGAHVGGKQAAGVCLPPVAGAESSRKRVRRPSPFASSADGGLPVQKKGRKKSTSPW
jgi:hypothetical protein